MPYAFESHKIPMPRSKDRRVKLTENQRWEIRESSLSQRKLAAFYGVSRRLIQFVKDPEKLAANLLARQERGGWQQYYDREDNRESMKQYRRYKQGVMKNER